MLLPSTCSRKLCCVSCPKLLQKQWDHSLLSLGFYFNPLFREMEFIEDRLNRSDHRSNAEEFAWKLVRNYKGLQRRSNAASSIVHEDNDNSNVNDTADVQGFDANSYSKESRVGGKRQFGLFLRTDSVPKTDPNTR